MPSNTTYNPQNKNDFEKSKLNKDAQGTDTSITLSGVTNIDLTLTDDELLTGAALLVTGAHEGDNVDFQVLAPGGTVVVQFVTGWRLDPTETKQLIPNSDFPAKIPAGFTLRVVYHAGGPAVLGVLNTAVWLAINYDMQKVLV